MPAPGWNNVSLSDEDIKDVLEIGQWLLSEDGDKVTLPRSIRAMIKRLQRMKARGEKVDKK